MLSFQPYRVLHALAVVWLSVASSISSAALTDNSFVFLGIQVGRGDTLASVMRGLGKTEEWGSGDASTSETKICYRIKGGENDLIIVFASSAEMASPPGQINHIRVYAVASMFAQRKRCSLIDVSAHDLKTSDGLRLGLSPAEIQAILGPKRVAKNQSLNYSGCSKRYLKTSDPYFDRWVGKSDCFENPGRPYFSDCSFAEFKFSNGRTTYMSLNRNQSVC